MRIISDINKFKEKEELYIKVRDAEKRVLTDEDLKKLPYLNIDGAIGNEWKARAARFEKFVAYIDSRYKQKQLSIADIGCGNGWMTHKLQEQGHSVTGIDLNMVELTQAEKVFGTSDSLQWVYADVMNEDIGTDKYDLIILSASCQYFPDLKKLTDRLKGLLTQDGEIHLIDSMFYEQKEVVAAKDRSANYYEQLGYPSMKNYYFHHDVSTLKSIGYTRVYPKIFSFKKGGLQWWKYAS